MAKAPKLGEILIQLGYLTPARLDAVLMHQRQWGVSLGRAAVAKNFCTEAQVLEGLSRQLKLPGVALDNEELDPELAKLLPQKDAEKLHTVPIRVTGARAEVLVVAMAAPANPATQDAVLALTKKARLQIFLSTDEALHRAIGRLYRGDQFTPMGEEAMLGNREQIIDPSAFEGQVEVSRSMAPLSSASDDETFVGLTLSAECKQVIKYGADVRKATPRSIIEKVLEDWAAKQRQAWAKSKG
jgi:Type II secretion system (T2SS), protein E, N-terminal domain